MIREFLLRNALAVTMPLLCAGAFFTGVVSRGKLLEFVDTQQAMAASLQACTTENEFLDSELRATNLSLDDMKSQVESKEEEIRSLLPSAGGRR